MFRYQQTSIGLQAEFWVRVDRNEQPMEIMSHFFTLSRRPFLRTVFILSLLLSWATSAFAQPKIVTQPSSRMLFAGTSYTFRLGATGTAPLSYQWYFNDTALTDATNSNLLLTNLQRNLAGQYFAVVSNVTGVATSQVARLDVYFRSGIFDIGDPDEFAKVLSTNAVLTRLTTISDSWLEGPVWVPSDGGYLVFSATDERKLKKLIPPSTLTNYFVCPANTLINGNLLDLHERLISCEEGSAGLKIVIMTNGAQVPLLTQYTNGLKFYSPNDLAIKSDGSIWFTDPDYGTPASSHGAPGYQPGLFVYRFFETNGNATVLQVITNMTEPNGICFSPDEKRLYVCDTFPNPGIIKAFDVTSSNTVTGGSLFATAGSGVADGIKCDVEGHVWAGCGDGVEIFAPDGHLVGRIRMSPIAVNLCFGGPEYQTLYIVGQPYVTSIPVLVPGAVSIKRLAVSRQASQIRLVWPAPSTGFTLQQSQGLGTAADWADVAESPGIVDDSNTVNVEATEPATFFRLQAK
jgi:gluconolactonase